MDVTEPINDEPAIDAAPGPTQPEPTPQRPDGEGTRNPKSPLRLFASWVSRQSLPRLLGLLVGNTRELEGALVKAEAEILRLRQESFLGCELLRTQAEIREAQWSARYDALANSLLMRQGMLPLTAEAREMVSSQGTQAIEPRTTAKQLEIEAEADKLLEMLQRGDVIALDERIAVMAESSRPLDKRILQAFAKRESQLTRFEKEADIGMEVIIGPAEARSVS